MAGKLSARTVDSLKEPGRYSDGGNLYLFITPNGGKRWTFIYRLGGKRREMGLGSAGTHGVSLKEARDKAAEARRLVAGGVDPIAHRQRAEAATVPTFGRFADDYVSDHRPKFRNAKHAAQWETTLSDDYIKSLRKLPLDKVDTAAVLAVLKPLWARIPETASRIRGRIENVLDAARARGLHPGPNPAAWRGHLKSLLPARQKLARVHHPALGYDALPAFMALLRSREALAARALELCILTATRTSEVLNAEWSEFDLEKKVWTIPASRMKAGRAHRVPLSNRALDILKAIPRLADNSHVFSGHRRGKPLSGMSMEKALGRMKRADITVHGFRSTFRDWAAETTSFPHHTAEHALAHKISDRAEAAYRRGDELERRRSLMQAWATWCEPRTGGNVVQMRKGGT